MAKKGKKSSGEKTEKMVVVRCEATGKDLKVPLSSLDDLHDPKFRIFAKGERDEHLKKEQMRGARLINRDAIYVSPNRNVRRFDTENKRFEELLESVKAHGIITPLIVRRTDEHLPFTYELVAGFRRVEAATRAEIEQVPCVVADKDDDPKMIGLLENLGREDMNPVEKATILRHIQYASGKKLSQRQLAAKTGMTQSSVSDHLALLSDVADTIATKVADGEMPVSKAAILKQLPPKEQVKLVDSAIAMDIRELRKHVGKVRTDLGIEPPTRKQSPNARSFRTGGRKYKFISIMDCVTEEQRLHDLVFEKGLGKKSDRARLAVLQWVLGLIETPKFPQKFEKKVAKKATKRSKKQGAPSAAKKTKKAGKE